MEFLYLSGWRKSASVKLEWRDIDLNGKTVRLRGLEEQRGADSAAYRETARDNRGTKIGAPPGLHVRIHVKGRPIKEFRKTWRTACVAAGVGRIEKSPDGRQKRYKGVIEHDLRRCAA